MSTELDYWHYFATGYVAARERFREAASRAEAEQTTHAHPTARGPGGEVLSIDVARIGAASAPRQLLAISGTHGLEGAAGSAVQVAWLATAARQLPAGVAVTLIHGLNPYGFAHATRTTENNVDLNRNFVDHDAPYPGNADYAELHERLIPGQWDRDALADAVLATEAFRDRHGADALFNVLASGQYTHPEGLVYGGSGREWSNRVLQQIVDAQLAQAERVGFIDWHTGIGDYAEPFFLCFNEEGSALQREAARWWGGDRILRQRPHGLARPNYQGLVFNGVERFLGGRPMVGAVVEFGTRGPNTSLSTRLDQWLRFKAPLAPDAQRDALLRDDLRDAFVPYSAVWRRSVVRHGLQITAQALDGLAGWQ
ncbi:M14 family metallopeptidase [Cupriavidus sp. WS]|uniref:M14 family metallopeptidase n=1 Tax=Cupriavidus sp. WS TaxID=1312922 RepID=UPI00036372E1|nr:M14 family metallopeptidase [Cupriavidus sp. WS]